MSLEKMIEMKVDEMTEQVTNLLEVADSLLNPEWTPESVIDVVHLLVRSLNLDVVCMVLPALRELGPSKCALSRGFKHRPGKEVLDIWFDTYNPDTGIDWKKLMAVAADKNSYSSYWIVEEGLDCIGYVPLRDGNFIHGFLFVASNGKKEQSSLTSPLLDLCGSHIGLSYAVKYTGP
ncbi:MAG: hypothetical protein JW808_02045 [Victivallales bacterium]|nr:hypothetical protein [Victivallales bacterium]